MIDSTKWYSVSEISKACYAPVIDTDRKVKLLVDKGILKGTTNMVKGTGKRYYIKGDKLIEFLAKWEAGDFHR